MGGIERLQKKISEGGNTKIWVAKEAVKIGGFIRIDKSDEKNSLRALYVLPGYQGRGIGKKLMELGLDWVDSDKQVVLEVAEYNNNAINFYKSFGFMENGCILNEAGKLPSGNVIPEIEMVKESTS